MVADAQRLKDLDEGLRKYLAWESILEEKESLDLRPHQVRQAQTQLKAAEGTINARLPETYQWLLVPLQTSPQAAISWEALRMTGTEALAVRASKKLRGEELLLTSIAPSRLRMELDRIPLWRSNHVAVHQLTQDFAQYPYLPRLKNAAVLINAITDGVGLLSWQHDSFACADSYDSSAERYRGLRGGQSIHIVSPDSDMLLVKPGVAAQQMEADQPKPNPQPSPGSVPENTDTLPTNPIPTNTTTEPAKSVLKRYHGTVMLDSSRVGRDAGKIAEEVISHLAGLVGANVTVTLEIEASLPDGVPDHVVRIVTENGQTLKFDSGHGFEED